MYCHFCIIVSSLLYYCFVTTVLLYFHYCIIVLSLLYYCIVTTVLLYCHYYIIVFSLLYYCIVTTALLFCHYFIIVLSLLYNSCTVWVVYYLYTIVTKHRHVFQIFFSAEGGLKFFNKITNFLSFNFFILCKNKYKDCT